MPTASEIIAAARSAATLPACERRAMCINRKEQQRQELARRNRLRTERENLIPPTYCYLPFKDGMKVVSPPESRPRTYAGDWIIKAQDGLRVLSPRKFAAYYQIIALNGEHNLEEAR